MRGVLAGRDREPEVAELHLVRSGDEQVARLHVAVDEALLVQVLERARGLEDDLERDVLGERPFAIEPLERGLSVDELHDEVVQAVDGVMVEAAHEVLVLEPAQEVALGLEPGARDRVAGEPRAAGS